MKSKKSETPQKPNTDRQDSSAQDTPPSAVKHDGAGAPKGRRRRYALAVCQGAVIAALYVALPELSTLAGLSSGVIQFRISEALCILPAFTPAAIPGLFVGCLISNLLAGGIPLDIIFGSVATLLGAIGAYLLRRYPWLVPIPTVVANVLIVPPILKYAYGIETAFASFSALPAFMFTVGVGEVVCAYILGIALWFALKPHRKRLFPDLH